MPKIKKISDYEWLYKCECGNEMKFKHDDLIFKDYPKEILKRPVKCFNCLEGENENQKSVNHVKGRKQNNQNRKTNSGGQSGSLFE